MGYGQNASMQIEPLKIPKTVLFVFVKVLSTKALDLFCHLVNNIVFRSWNSKPSKPSGHSGLHYT